MQPPASGPAGPAVNIMLVDDEPANLLALEAILAAPGRNLVRARSGEDALRRVLADDFAVIVLDLHLPGLDGFETARLIRSRPRSAHTPIIFMTAHGPDAFPVEQAYELGAVDYLLKPVNPVVLRAKIAVFVELGATSQALRAEVKERERAERLAQDRARQQAAVAGFGHRALAGAGPDALMADAAGVVAETLEVRYARVAEHLPGGEYLIRAGVGWRPGTVGRTLAGNEIPLIDLAVRVGGPVVCEDWRTEARFPRPQFLAEHGVVSSIAAPIPRPGSLFGVLAADATTSRAFTENDRHFVRAVAAVLAAAIERQAAEDKVRAVALELQRSNAELEQFAYVASHDLQEPLRKIQAFGDRLRDKHRDQLGEQGRDYVDRMLASAGRMRRLIDDLLTFSRVTTQARPFEPVDLGELVRQVVSDLEARLQQTGGRVEVGELPIVFGDPTQLRQLFQNLIGNGLKYHRPGVPPEVRVTGRVLAEGGDPVCEVTVADNGIGFDEKYLDRIFQVFQRLHSRDEYEGTGIGLAICKKIVERHGGTITARSEPGQGATFVVTLPVKPESPRPQ
jgi:signal transduction histidine kinase/CheY-like chemotaxis protein